MVSRTTICVPAGGLDDGDIVASSLNCYCMSILLHVVESGNLPDNRLTGQSGKDPFPSLLSLFYASMSRGTNCAHSLIVVNSKLSGADSFQGYGNAFHNLTSL